MLIVKKYLKGPEEVENIMRWKIIEYEAKTIRNDERKKGHRRTYKKKIKEKTTAVAEEHAKAMLRDHVELSSIEKYTDFPMSRIQELARDLGMA